MQETPQQYTQRMLNHSRGKDPVGLQQAAPRKLATLTKGLNKKRLTLRPEPGKWSIAEILSHLSDAELVVGFRLRLILASNGTPIQAFDQDSWAAAGHYQKRDPRKSAEQFRVLREANPALLKPLAHEQWKHHGMHAERGVETIEHIVRMMAGHDVNHTKQVERILERKK